jgi:hypothetical protein
MKAALGCRSSRHRPVLPVIFRIELGIVNEKRKEDALELRSF